MEESMFDIQPKDVVIPVIQILIMGILIFAIQFAVARHFQKKDDGKARKLELVSNLQSLAIAASRSCIEIIYLFEGNGQSKNFESAHNKQDGVLVEFFDFYRLHKTVLPEYEAAVTVCTNAYKDYREAHDKFPKGPVEDGDDFNPEKVNELIGGILNAQKNLRISADELVDLTLKNQFI